MLRSLAKRHGSNASLRSAAVMATASYTAGSIYNPAIERYPTMHSEIPRLGREDFRVCHISIQNTHLHLLVEAVDRAALTRGMQSFGIRLARQVHTDGGCGKVFEYRYHATQIRTAWHARHALAYVLNNWRRHQLDWANGRVLAQNLDVYASGISFDGWTDRRPFLIPRGYDPLPVARASTALLAFEWKRFGLIDFFETPGPLR